MVWSGTPDIEALDILAIVTQYMCQHLVIKLEERRQIRGSIQTHYRMLKHRDNAMQTLIFIQVQILTQQLLITIIAK